MVTYYYKTILIITGSTENPAPPDGPGTDRELIDWLQVQGVDANTIKKVKLWLKSIPLVLLKSCSLILNLFQIVDEDYTLSDILNDITKEDLRCLRLR